MDYNAPSGSTDLDADYVGATASTIGSKIPPRVPTLTQREIVNIEKVAGLTPSNDDRTQLAQGIGRGIWLGTLGANPNALVGAIGGGANPTKPGILQSLNTWTRLRGIAAQTNTSPTVTFTITGVATVGGAAAGLLKKRDGSAPAVGDVPVGFPFEMQWDGTNFRFVGAVASDGGGIAAAQAAKSPFNSYPFQQSARTALTATGPGVTATAFSGITFNKLSPTSKLKIYGRFQTRSTYAPGNGNGAQYFNFNVGTGTFRQALNNGYPQFSAGTVLYGVIYGQPMGALAVSATMEREDNLQWFTTIFPTSADESGYPSVNAGDFEIIEQE